MYSESTGDKNQLLRIGSDTIPQEIQTNKSFLLIHSVHIKSCQVEREDSWMYKEYKYTGNMILYIHVCMYVECKLKTRRNGHRNLNQSEPSKFVQL